MCLIFKTLKTLKVNVIHFFTNIKCQKIIIKLNVSAIKHNLGKQIKFKYRRNAISQFINRSHSLKCSQSHAHKHSRYYQVKVFFSHIFTFLIDHCPEVLLVCLQFSFCTFIYVLFILRFKPHLLLIARHSSNVVSYNFHCLLNVVIQRVPIKTMSQSASLSTHLMVSPPSSNSSSNHGSGKSFSGWNQDTWILLGIYGSDIVQINVTSNSITVQFIGQTQTL